MRSSKGMGRIHLVGNRQSRICSNWVLDASLWKSRRTDILGEVASEDDMLMGWACNLMAKLICRAYRESIVKGLHDSSLLLWAPCATCGPAQMPLASRPPRALLRAALSGPPRSNIKSWYDLGCTKRNHGPIYTNVHT